MYTGPITIASLAFVAATVLEILAIEMLRGSVLQWMPEHHRSVLVLVMIGINATQGALFGYAAHRAARNALLWHRAEQDRRELTFCLGAQLRPAFMAADSVRRKESGTVPEMLLRTAVTVFNRYYREKRMRLHTSVMPTNFSKPLKENSIQRS